MWTCNWLIWQKCQRANAIINCPSCVVIVRHWCLHCHLWMLLLLTDLITKTTYFAYICTYAPGICTYIFGQYDLYFLNSSHFAFFGSFGNEPMQSCSVCRVSLSSSSVSASVSVYSPPSDSFDHRSFISYKYMQLCP